MSTDVSEVRAASIALMMEVVRTSETSVVIYLHDSISQKTELQLNFFFFPVCAITASGVPGGTFVSMNRFSTLCG
jgi:hypothetical protein